MWFAKVPGTWAHTWTLYYWACTLNQTLRLQFYHQKVTAMSHGLEGRSEFYGAVPMGFKYIINSMIKVTVSPEILSSSKWWS